MHVPTPNIRGVPPRGAARADPLAPVQHLCDSHRSRAYGKLHPVLAGCPGGCSRHPARTRRSLKPGVAAAGGLFRGAGNISGCAVVYHSLLVPKQAHRRQSGADLELRRSACARATPRRGRRPLAARARHTTDCAAGSAAGPVLESLGRTRGIHRSDAASDRGHRDTDLEAAGKVEGESEPENRRSTRGGGRFGIAGNRRLARHGAARHGTRTTALNAVKRTRTSQKINSPRTSASGTNSAPVFRRSAGNSCCCPRNNEIAAISNTRHMRQRCRAMRAAPEIPPRQNTLRSPPAASNAIPTKTNDPDPSGPFAPQRVTIAPAAAAPTAKRPAPSSNTPALF